MSDNEHERLVDTEPEVLEGDDDIPREPAPPLDPYTPEPGPRPGEQRAFNVLRWAWVPIVVAVLLILIAVFR
ncbi:MAG TPA: hypothetical protein VGU26_08485 [Gaiellaceae bacterium]|jgi:hypothetical protein|nr:hypothetical protein [Gaiellaceae bacterium]